MFCRVYMVFLNIAETLNDVTRPDDSGAIVDSLMAGQGDAVLDTDDIDYETEHDSRKRHVAMQDPVHTVVLKDYVQSQVKISFFFEVHAITLHKMFCAILLKNTL